MITEKVFDLFFAIPKMLYSFIPNLPALPDGGGFAGLVEIFTIGNIFFPVDRLFLFLLAWLALGVLSMSKTFIEWIYKLIPLT